MNKNKSFTLIELLVVIVIIGILAGVIMISTSSSINKANFAKAQAFSSTVQEELLFNLVSEWLFDEPEVSNKTLDSWQNNDGILSGTTPPLHQTSSNCVFGKCYYFSGDDYINCGNNTILQINSGTMSAWIKTSDAGSSHRGIIVKQGAYGIFLLNNIFVIYDWTTASNATTNANLADGLWHYVLASFDQNASNGTKLYIDGVLKIATTLGISSQTTSLTIGNGSTANTDQAIKGYLDNVKLYNTVLSSFETKQNYIIGLNSMLSNGNISKQEYDNRINKLAYDN